MNTKSIHFKDLLLDSDFQKMQDEIAVATNVAMITVDYSGTPITLHSSCNDFCKIIREDNRYKHLCEKCDSRGGVEAARLQKPYLYLCHMGIVDFAIPIIASGLYMGAVMAGQLRIDDNDNEQLECIVSEKSNYHLMDNRLKEAYDRLPKMPHSKILALSNIISYLSNTYIGEILAKNSIDEPINNEIYNENSSYYHNNKVKQLISPAISYIEKNYNSNFDLNFLAELCQISNSYLSRLFKKAIGCNFAHYVNLVRISHAKDLLVSTNQSITSMAIDLGYEDAGYFIKVFKRIEKLTPNEYRNRFGDSVILEELKINALLDINK